jgi:murein DD-endopeptidase MepM/ murein hydrolase activator NlpD
MLRKIANYIKLSFFIFFCGVCFSQSVSKNIDYNFVYNLPFKEGKKVYILQGYNGRYSHRGDYALDFRLRKGNEIFAAREGTIVSTEDDNTKGGPRKKFLTKGNHIIIKHSDGTFAAYWHLSHKGVLVKIGESVQKGQLIGISGNTGYSSRAHLHFDVYYFENGKQITIPTKFQTANGIEELKVYHSYRKPSDLGLNEKVTIPKNIDKIEYRFNDASVPPEYHRSYSWIVTESKVQYILDSYGSILKDTTIEISELKWEQCKNAFLNCGIKNHKNSNSNQGCTGGTSVTIKTWLNGKENFSGTNYYCGGKTEGNLTGDTEKFLLNIQLGIDPDIFSND